MPVDLQDMRPLHQFHTEMSDILSQRAQAERESRRAAALAEKAAREAKAEEERLALLAAAEASARGEDVVADGIVSADETNTEVVNELEAGESSAVGADLSLETKEEKQDGSILSGFASSFDGEAVPTSLSGGDPSLLIKQVSSTPFRLAFVVISPF